jgi:hypothetical protein
MGTTEKVNAEEPGSSRQVGVQDSPDAGFEVRNVDQSKVSQHLGEPEGRGVKTAASTPEADLHSEASDRDRSHTEANTSELRPNESEAAPNTEAAPNAEAAPNTEAAPSVGPSSSRVSAGFEVLGKGLLGHPMEAIKNLIPEGVLGNAGVSSPDKIAQGILISHYQVSFSFRKQTFVLTNF